MRDIFLAGNWKMNYDHLKAREVAKQILDGVKNFNKTKIMLAPSFTSLHSVGEVLKNSNILLGAQNISVKDSGARTSEISAEQLKALNVDTIILGHSECREFLFESDDIVNEKVKQSLNHGFKLVILCVGETLEIRERGETLSFVLNQIRKGLKGISSQDMSRVVIAYEPVWAIGTGKVASPSQAQEVHSAIRAEIKNIYSNEISDKLIIQYGGSVNSQNIEELLREEDIDGALIGGASLKADSFIDIIKKANS